MNSNMIDAMVGSAIHRIQGLAFPYLDFVASTILPIRKSAIALINLVISIIVPTVAAAIPTLSV
ncbi:hypothetical protein D3C74_454620 [compost metagenome]